MKHSRFLSLVLIITITITLTFSMKAYGQQETKVSVYVDPLPDWASYASNVMYESTKAWEDANPTLKFYKASTLQGSDIQVRWVKEFVGEHIGQTVDGHFIEVGLGDSKCKGTWHPYSSNYIDHIMEHEIGHALGHEHSSDPNSIMYPVALNLEYGSIKEEFTITKSYDQFVSFCIIKDITSYYYQVSTDDPTYGFKVYVIPSKDEFNRALAGKSFNYYSGEGCFGKDFQSYLSYGDTCNGIAKGGGLLIIMDNQQTQDLTKITVTQQEIRSTTNNLQATDISVTPDTQYPSPQPTPSSSNPETLNQVNPIPEPQTPSIPPTQNVIQVTGTQISVPYTIQGGTLTAIWTSPYSNSLFANIQSTNNGELVLFLPRQLIDSQNNGQDLGFVVTGDRGISYKETSSTSQYRIISLDFSSGDNLIQITGSQVAAPEFGSIVSLVLVISIISVIGISNKMSKIWKSL